MPGHRDAEDRRQSKRRDPRQALVSAPGVTASALQPEDLLDLLQQIIAHEGHRSSFAGLIKRSLELASGAAQLDPLVDLHVAKELSGLGKTAIYARVRDGGFPRPFKIGTATRWSRSELEAWRAQHRA